MSDERNVEPASTGVSDEIDPAKGARRDARIDFWFGSIARATFLLYVSTFVIMSAFFVYSEVQAGGFAVGTVFDSIFAAALWALLLLVGSCYFSIPIATLLVAAVRGLLRRRHRAPAR